MKQFIIEVRHRITPDGHTHTYVATVEAPDRWRAALAGIQDAYSTLSDSILLGIEVYERIESRQTQVQRVVTRHVTNISDL